MKNTNNKRYVVKFHENTRGNVTFASYGEACLYARNVSKNFSPFEACVNEIKENGIMVLKCQWILGAKF